MNAKAVADNLIENSGRVYFSEQVSKYGKSFSIQKFVDIADKLDKLGDGSFGKVGLNKIDNYMGD